MKMNHTCFCVLDADKYRHYIEHFNRLYPESIANAISDGDAWNWMQGKIPFLDCSSRVIEEIYYFRWWTYPSHDNGTAGPCRSG